MGNVEIRQLDALLAVADHRSFSAAARALHTVQSNISTHVAKLERSLGAELYDRRVGRLTPAGELVAHRARRIRSELTALSGDVASLRAEVSGATALGLIGTTGRWLAAELIGAVTAEHPRIDLTVVEATTAGLVPQLLGGRIDLAVISLPAPDPELEVDPLFDEELVVIIPGGHRWNGREQLGLAELAEEPLVMGPVGHAVRDVLDQTARHLGVTLRPLAVIDGVRLTASLAFEGFGPAIVPASAAPRHLTGDWDVARVADGPSRRVGAARRTRSAPSAPTRAVLDVMRRLIAGEGSAPPGIHPISGDAPADADPPDDAQHAAGPTSPG